MSTARSGGIPGVRASTRMMRIPARSSRQTAHHPPHSLRCSLTRPPQTARHSLRRRRTHRSTPMLRNPAHASLSRRARARRSTGPHHVRPEIRMRLRIRREPGSAVPAFSHPRLRVLTSHGAQRLSSGDCDCVPAVPCADEDQIPTHEFGDHLACLPSRQTCRHLGLAPGRHSSAVQHAKYTNLLDTQGSVVRSPYSVFRSLAGHFAPLVSRDHLDALHEFSLCRGESREYRLRGWRKVALPHN